MTLVIGSVCVGLALQGLLWAMQQKPQRHIPTIAAPGMTPPPAPAPTIEPTPVPPPEAILFPEPDSANTAPPVPVMPPAAMPEIPPVAPPAAESTDWLHDMQQALIQCQSVFCRERVRWKYCDKRWDSVPACTSSQNSVQESDQGNAQ
ncbi:hypothetical protein AGMMS49545_04380 [Betaproteobacteria bacterium]|nr:hypothetical protein AGMMS49545_04380 [Betaproteobacteria bacterium]GHU40922.1 hypothetical protein AGMMS50289_03230 [Betaproteobacteria bacterium]